VDRPVADFPVEYQYQSLPGAEERLAHALDLVLQLILNDLRESEPTPADPSTPEGAE
jgi:hypothetical protein